jgi:hypothetical protein
MLFRLWHIRLRDTTPRSLIANLYLRKAVRGCIVVFATFPVGLIRYDDHTMEFPLPSIRDSSVTVLLTDNSFYCPHNDERKCVKRALCCAGGACFQAPYHSVALGVLRLTIAT